MPKYRSRPYSLVTVLFGVYTLANEVMLSTDFTFFCFMFIRRITQIGVDELFLLLARYVPNVAKEEYMRSV